MSDYNELKNFYQDKRILITGHTGFKGSWLSIMLLEMGAELCGYSLDPISNKDNFVLSELENKMQDIRGDIRKIDKVSKVFEDFKPDMVFHLAAQPLVRESYLKPVETYQTNVMGTINILECIRKNQNVRAGILITTDKCYENKEQIWGYRENDSMGGFDPYSSSKGCAELAIQSWRQSFMNVKDFNTHKKALVSVRAGNVIGGGDWNINRLIPDCVRSIEKSIPIKIRSPNATRPWQHVLDPLYGYLSLGKSLWNDPKNFSGSWNFGPELFSIITVGELVAKFIQSYGSGEVIDDSKNEHPHEAKLLMLDISKAFFKLNWKPTLSIDQTIDFTTNWYRNYKFTNVYDLSVEQINQFYSMK